MQRWRKLGRVFVPDGHSDWMASHASYPTALPLDNGLVRIFFSPRDRENRSSVGFLDLSLIDERWEIVQLAREPSLRPGPRGAFDDSGVTVGCVIRHGERLRLYYLGWSLSITVPFRNFIGLAEAAAASVSFTRVSPAPVLDRSGADPFTLGYPWILREPSQWRIWYGSHLAWGKAGLDMTHVIKTGRSFDGVAWQRSGEIAIDIAGPPEYAVSRPCVLRDGDRYRMWYARRAPDYRLGYADSADGSRWVRRDGEVGLEPSADGWDSDCVTYPCVFPHGGRLYMAYNGNGFGRSGFGLAVLDE